MTEHQSPTNSRNGVRKMPLWPLMTSGVARTTQKGLQFEFAPTGLS